jgi:NAD(P)H dehydrogenase (quinone)
MIAVTGASGQLGHLVIEELLRKIPAAQIIAAARTLDRVKDLAARGVQARHADYNRPETLDSAFAGADKVLLISSSEVGRRFPQHKAVIDAAKRSGVKLLAYTSLLHADTSPLGLAEEHKATEAYLKASGVPFVVLRNGWYTENYTASIPPALKHGAFLGCAGDGRISSAARADYATAAAAVLTLENQAGKIYELAGDESYTLADLAAEISRQSGKAVAYKNLAEAEFKAALMSAGLPEPIAGLLADSDTGASKGGLFDGSGILGLLIGRSTTPMAVSVKAVL